MPSLTSPCRVLCCSTRCVPSGINHDSTWYIIMMVQFIPQCTAVVQKHKSWWFPNFQVCIKKSAYICLTLGAQPTARVQGLSSSIESNKARPKWGSRVEFCFGVIVLVLPDCQVQRFVKACAVVISLCGDVVKFTSDDRNNDSRKNQGCGH